MAWRIFFPEKLKNASPKEEVKRRLKMVLVADRCGMSPASLSEMKKTIAKALQVRNMVLGCKCNPEQLVSHDWFLMQQAEPLWSP